MNKCQLMKMWINIKYGVMKNNNSKCNKVIMRNEIEM